MTIIFTPAPTLEEIKDIIDSNIKQGKDRYTGLASSDIGVYSRALMFGDNDEAFDEDEFRAWID